MEEVNIPLFNSRIFFKTMALFIEKVVHTLLLKMVLLKENLGISLRLD
jgi:hypothetical protein